MIAKKFRQCQQLPADTSDAIDCSVQHRKFVVEFLEQSELLRIVIRRRGKTRILYDRKCRGLGVEPDGQLHQILSWHHCRARLRLGLVGQWPVLEGGPWWIDAHWSWMLDIPYEAVEAATNSGAARQR